MTILVTLVALYAVLVVVAFAVQRSMLYPAPREPETPRLANARLVRIPGEQGRTVFAFYVAPRDGAPDPAPVVVHFHGNGEALAHQTWLAEDYERAGLGFFAVEYPGYGLAHAYAPAEAAILSDAATALQYLHAELGVPVERTVLEGQSLGSGVAAEMARRKLGARLILISAYTSIAEVAQAVVPILPMRWIVRDRYDTERIAPEIRVPALVIHGDRDTLIPIAMGRRVAARIAGSRFVPVAGAGHNDVFDLGGPALWREMTSFARGTP